MIEPGHLRKPPRRRSRAERSDCAPGFGSLHILLACSLATLIFTSSAAAIADAAELRPADVSDVDEAKSAGSVDKESVSVPSATSEQGTFRPPDSEGTKSQEPVAIPVLDAESFRQFSTWLQSQETPAYDALSAVLTGEADDERAVLTASIAIQVNRSEEWVSVPLRLDQSFLLEVPKHQYEGSEQGAARPDNERHQRDRGYHWWFRGQGIHRLTLVLSVPIQKNRLMLALPDPPAAATVLDLQIRGPSHVSVKATERSSVRIQPGRGGSQVLVHGFGSLLDVSWQAVPQQKMGQTDLQVTTLVLVQLGVESMVLEASQTVRPLRGSVDQLTVRLPQDFELLDVTGKTLQDYEVQSDGNVRLTLSSGTTELVQIKWTLLANRDSEQLELPPLEGFEVQGARRQTGYVAIQTAEGFHVTSRSAEERFVHRVNVSDLRLFQELRTAVGTGEIVGAYRFLRQPFHLSLELERIEPYYTVEPYLFLKLSADRAELEAVFACQVYRGALRELILRWPADGPQGWTLSPLESTEAIEEIVPAQGDDSATHRVRLVQPRTRTDGPFEIRLQGRRPVAGDGNAFPLQLPSIQASTLPPTTLALATADNVDVDFLPTGATVLRRSTGLPMPLSGIPDLVRGLRYAMYRVDSAEQDFSAQITVHEQQVQVESRVHAEFIEDRLMVRQHIAYDVAYERMAQVRLLVPREIADAVGFSITQPQTTFRVVPSWGDSEVDSVRRARITLDEPRLGRFEIQAEYSLKIPEDQHRAPAAFRMPLIVSDDSDYHTVQLELSTQDTRSVRVDEPGWTHYITADRAGVWSVGGHKGQIPLAIDPGADVPRYGVAVPKTLLWTTLTDSGAARTCAAFLFRGQIDVLPIRLAPNLAVEDVWWDQQPVPDQSITRTDEPERQIVLALSDLGSPNAANHWLVMVCTSENGQPFHWGEEHGINVPQLPRNLVSGQTYWRIALPRTEHLLTHARALTAQFAWTRATVFWSRKSILNREQLLEWLADPGPSGQKLEETTVLASLFREGANGNYENVYLFGTDGIPTSGTIRTLSRSSLVGVGAGLAFLAALLLIKVPMIRNTLTLLGLGLTLAVVGVWYESAVKVLLQPAVLGIVLAVVAVLIDAVVRRRRMLALGSMAAPSELAKPPSSVVRAALPGSDHGVPANGAPGPGPPSQPASVSGAGSES